MTNLIRILICLVSFGLGLYLYLDKINAQTEIRFKIPMLEKEIEEIEQSSIQLAYQLENFNNPKHLLELAQQPQYSHLKFPFSTEVMVISSEIAKRGESNSEKIEAIQPKARWPIFLGSSQ